MFLFLIPTFLQSQDFGIINVTNGVTFDNSIEIHQHIQIPLNNIETLGTSAPIYLTYYSSFLSFYVVNNYFGFNCQLLTEGKIEKQIN